jgi:hypothetical protein
MNEFLFEYYYDPTRKECCLNCVHYFRHMKGWDVNQIMEINKITEYKFGQKICIKHKIFVFMSDACGHFNEWIDMTQLPLIKQNPFEDYE